MIICADDAGMAPEIDDAILDLAAMGRVSAVSCMMAGRRLPPLALRDRAALDLGLHVILTDEAPVAGPGGARTLLGLEGRMLGFSELLRRAFAGRIDPADADREVAAQHARFTTWAGRPPDFLDSHLHVHQFPGVRTGVLRFVLGLPRAGRPYVRNAHLSLGRVIAQNIAVSKCIGIGWLGGRLRRRLRAAGIATNDEFGGIYDLRRYRDFPRYLRRFAATLTDRNGIIMTHPGLEGAWRRTEYEAIRDAAYLNAIATRFDRGGARTRSPPA